MCVALRGSVFGLALGFLELRSAKFRIVNRTFSVVLVTDPRRWIRAAVLVPHRVERRQDEAHAVFRIPSA